MFEAVLLILIDGVVREALFERHHGVKVLYADFGHIHFWRRRGRDHRLSDRVHDRSAALLKMVFVIIHHGDEMQLNYRFITLPLLSTLPRLPTSVLSAMRGRIPQTSGPALPTEPYCICSCPDPFSD